MTAREALSKTLNTFWIGAAMIVFSLATGSANATEADALHQVFEDYWEHQMREYPTWASNLGDHRYDELLTDVSKAAQERREAADKTFLTRLEAIDRTALNETDKVSADMFALQIERSIEGAKFKDYTMPIGQQSGPQIGFPGLIGSIVWDDISDYEGFHKRMLAFNKHIAQHIDNMREGIRLGLVPTRVNIEPVVAQIESFIVDDVTTSHFYGPIRENKAGLSDEEISQLEELYQAAIAESVIPAFRSLRDFIVNEYLPACREEFGVWSLPDGAERYAYLIKYHTTLPLTPEQITQMGLDDLARIQVEMQEIITKVGFEGTRQEFFEYLHTDEQFYYTDKDSLLAGYQAILDSVKTKVPEIFGILPKAECFVKEMEEYQAKNAPTAYYNGPADDGSRPGYFEANTYNLKARPKYEMEALTYHEAIPGHHLQVATQMELEGLPKFRNHSWFTAYGEGWALYSERLPKELGFYQDPYQDFGRLIYDAWRACRLVVDCGLHYYKWDRQKAIDFMKENFGGTDLNVISEVDRYIAWPGQALGYKIGQLKILELRERAKTALGEKFSLSEYHDQILDQGSVPLPALERKIDEWIERKLQG